MIKYEDNLAARVNGNNLQPLAGAEVRVTDKATNLPAALYQDDELTPIPQPLTTDNNGYFAFKAADGKYTLTFSATQNSPRFVTFTREIVLEDPADNPFATLQELALPSGAAKIGYGSGRTVDDKLALDVDVEDYFVAGELSAGPMFQRAIDAVATAGGGRVLCAAKTYLFNETVILCSKVVLEGRSEAATILRQTNLSLPLIKSLDFDALVGTNNVGGIRRAGLRNMTIEGTMSGSVPAGTNAQHGVQLYGYGLTLENLHIRNFGGNNLYTEWATPGPAPDTGWGDGFVESVYANIKSYQAGLSGYYCNGPHDSQWSMFVSYGNNLKDTSADKPNIRVGAKASPQHMELVHAWGNTSGIALLAESPVNMTNCQLEGATIAQMRIKTGEVIMAVCRLFAAGSSSSVGVQWVGGPAICVGYNLNLTIHGCNGGSFDYDTGIDASHITARLYQTAGNLEVGTKPVGIGNTWNITAAGPGFPRKTAMRHFQMMATNLSITDVNNVGSTFGDHAGEGVVSIRQRSTQPPETWTPPSGVDFYARENAYRFHQQSGHKGAIMGEALAPVAPADNFDVSLYQLNTFSAPVSPVTINNFVKGLNGHPFYILMPTGGAEITITNTGNIRPKTGAALTRTGLGANRMIGFVLAKDGNYYQI